MKLILEQRCLFDGSVIASATHAAAGRALESPLLPEVAHRDGRAEADVSLPHEIVFVDPRVANWQQLVTGISANTQVIVLNPNRDALQQISDVLEHETNVTAIDILSHGSSGSIDAGATPVTAATVAADAAEVANWSTHLAANADIMIYGCDVGAGSAGKALLTELHVLTGAQVAASTDATGGTAAGGNWTLEVSTGTITAADPFNHAAEVAYDGVLLAPAPVPSVSISSSASVARPGSTITETVSFSNSGAAGSVGYNGFVDLFVPNALKNYTTVSGSGFTTKTTTLAAGANGTLTFTDPLTQGLVTLSQAEAARFGVAAGDEVISVSVPVGTWAQGTPAQDFTVSVKLPSTAAAIAPMLGNTYYIGAVGGFQYGDSASHTDSADWWQLGGQTASQAGNAVSLGGSDGTLAPVGVQLLSVDITVSTTPGENETATGPDYPVTYVIDINPASVIDSTNPLTGAGNTGIDISFTLPNTVVYTGHSDNITTGGTPTVSFIAPSANTIPVGDTGVPGGSIDIQLSSVTGEVKEYITVYVPKYSADPSSTEILASTGTSSLGVASNATATISSLTAPQVSGMGAAGNTDLYWNVSVLRPPPCRENRSEGTLSSRECDGRAGWHGKWQR